MPSPLVIPATIPPALSRVRFEPIDAAKTVEQDQGELRRRPLYSTVPQVLKVSWYLNQTQFDTWWDWYEETLEVGARKFDVPIERQGGPGAGSNTRLEWWTAQFHGEPYSVQTGPLGDEYEITAQLLLIGEPFDIRVPPGIVASLFTSTTLRAKTTPGRLRARLLTETSLRAVVGKPPLRVTLATATTLRWKTGAAPASYRITPEGDTRTTPEGDTRVHLG